MPLLEERLKAEAFRLGFDLVGIAPAEPADGFDRLKEWLARGYAGAMSYMERRLEARAHPRSILPTVQSVVMTAMNYKPAVEPPLPANHGRVARYARGPDYHDVLRARLKELLAWVQNERADCRGRAVVDTAPLLERGFARRAGLGWIGKNTMLLHPRLGSYFFLGALLLDLKLAPDTPFTADHCGTCTACLTGCPTDAFAGPGWLDARRCISYSTIELRGPAPLELRQDTAAWVFGCDICQEVCPWNDKAPATGGPFGAGPASLDLIELLHLSKTAYDAQFGATAIERTGHEGIRRNAAIALGNVGGADCVPALRAVLDDSSPTIREAALWAIGQIERRCSRDQVTLRLKHWGN